MALKNNSIEYIEINLKENQCRYKTTIEATPYVFGFADFKDFMKLIYEIAAIDGLVVTSQTSVIFITNLERLNNSMAYTEAFSKFISEELSRSIVHG